MYFALVVDMLFYLRSGFGFSVLARVWNAVPLEQPYAAIVQESLTLVRTTCRDLVISEGKLMHDLTLVAGAVDAVAYSAARGLAHNSAVAACCHNLFVKRSAVPATTIYNLGRVQSLACSYRSCQRG